MHGGEQLAEQTTRARLHAQTVLAQLRLARLGLEQEQGASAAALPSLASSSSSSSAAAAATPGLFDFGVRLAQTPYSRHLTSDSDAASSSCSSPALRRVQLADSFFDESSDDGEDVWTSHQQQQPPHSQPLRSSSLAPGSDERSWEGDESPLSPVSTASSFASSSFTTQDDSGFYDADAFFGSDVGQQQHEQHEQEWRAEVGAKLQQQCCASWRRNEEAEFIAALREDVAAWLSMLLKVPVAADTLLDDLADGTILCSLAAKVEEHQAGWCQQQGIDAPKPYPVNKLRAKPAAKAGSYYARDNVEKFVQWTRHFEAPVTFEVSDLVDKQNEKNVIYCLVDVARNSRGLDALPELIEMEREIDEEQRLDLEQATVTHEAPQASLNASDVVHGHGQQELCAQVDGSASVAEQCASVVSPQQPAESSAGQTPQHNSSSEHVEFQPSRSMTSPDELDDTVQSMARQTGIRLKRVKKGKYVVAKTNKNLFIRVLRKQVVVRVGGGWDTLKNYLATHEEARTGLNAGLLLHDGPDVDTEDTEQALLERAKATKLKMKHRLAPVKDLQVSVAMPVKAQTPLSDRSEKAKEGKYKAAPDDVSLCAWDEVPLSRRSSASQQSSAAKAAATGKTTKANGSIKRSNSRRGSKSRTRPRSTVQEQQEDEPSD